ncbi:response regulator [Echinicola marina]|uniref:response regulator n=1 Tax=Echinicola marina TaxID=2859768 RepID=UPI001CF6A546|nr:response regulator [Echinicola marina]UCS92473.1 response regulator [Echinicola marina]
MSKILILEKDQNFSSNICEILELYNYQTQQCYETHNLLKQIDDFVPDLLILSVSLDQKQSGIELVKKILPDNGLPILFISDQYLSEIFGNELKLMNNALIIYKPFSINQLISSVKEATTKLIN